MSRKLWLELTWWSKKICHLLLNSSFFYRDDGMIYEFSQFVYHYNSIIIFFFFFFITNTSLKAFCFSSWCFFFLCFPPKIYKSTLRHIKNVPVTSSMIHILIFPGWHTAFILTPFLLGCDVIPRQTWWLYISCVYRVADIYITG